jgi:hypothetical protein
MANRIPETVNGFRTSVEYRIATGVPAQRMTVSMVKTTAVRLSGAVGCVLRLLNRSRVRDWAERIARTGPGLRFNFRGEAVNLLWRTLPACDFQTWQAGSVPHATFAERKATIKSGPR